MGYACMFSFTVHTKVVFNLILAVFRSSRGAQG